MGVPRFGPNVEVNFRAIPSFRPQTPDAAQHLLAGLGTVFDSINQTVGRMAEARVAQEALAAGEKAGTVSGFDPNTLPEDFTVASENYRKGALQSFATQLELSRDQAFHQAQMDWVQLPEEARTPEWLSGKLYGWVEGTASKLPSEMQPGFRQLALAKAQPMVLNATEQFLNARQKQARVDNEALFNLYKDELIRNPLPANEVEQKAYDTTLAQLRHVMEGMDLSTPEKAVKTQDVLREIRSAALLRGFETEKDKVGYIEKFIQEDPAVLGLTSEEQNKLVDVMKSQVNDQSWVEQQRQVELTFGQKLGLELSKNDIESLVKDGAVSEKELMGFFDKNQEHLAPDWAANQLTALRAARQKISEEHDLMAGILAGEIPVDVSSEKTQSLVDKYVSQYLLGGENPVAGATITGRFGDQRPGHAHDGLDLATKPGTPIHSIRSGTVLKVGKQGGYGQVVEVLQDDGTTALYAHAERLLVKPGQTVTPGQPLATVGSTGNSTGPHLHLRIQDRQGKLVDPQAYLKKTASGVALDARQAMEEIIRKTGVVPTAYRNQLVALSHGPATQQAEAASRYGWLLDRGIELRGVSDKDRGLLARIYVELERGVPTEKAVEIAQFYTDPSNNNLLAANKERLKEVLKKQENRVELVFGSEGFLGIGRTIPGIPLVGGVKDNVQADWETAFSQAYLKTGGDETAARKEAGRVLKKLWGVSRLSGSDQLMKYPPEQIYGLSGYSESENAEWMRKQLWKEVGNQFMPRPEALFLVADKVTMRGGEHGTPDYLVFGKNKNGLFEPIILEGKHVRWRPDPVPEMTWAKQKREALLRQKVHQAKDFRSGKYHDLNLATPVFGVVK